MSTWAHSLSTKSSMLNNEEPLLISADGGLGDHVTAEPAIRYLLDHFYKDKDVHIAAHWPEVFAHLPATVHPHNFDRKGALYKTVWTLYNRTDPMWAAVCFLLAHMVDYTTMNMMQRMLPLADREIKLHVTDEARTKVKTLLGNINIKKVVAVHAGKSWQTKTFPLLWWQEVVDGLSGAGYTVCLFGKSTSPVPGDATGVVPVVCPPGGIDLRDKLTVGELFALLEAAPVLLTNDSSPVQIAGGFDNWIVMIATIKYPELVFPYRKGSTGYKTKALYKKLMAEEIFNTLDLSKVSVDFPVADWAPYLPEPAEVIREITSLS